MGYQVSATIVNGIRALSGKGAIYGAAASKHLAKILRSNVLTSVLSFAVFSIPETYNVAVRKISGAQYAKNMSVLAGSIAAGAGGAVAAGVVAAKVAGAAGTTVAPGVGTVVGIAGGFVGGVVGAKVVKVAGDILHEDDVETLGRLFNAYVSCMIGEYLLDEPEIDTLINKLNEITQKEFKMLFDNIAKSAEQETVDGYLIPLDDQYFRIDPKNLGFKYGGEITCVGMITNIIGVDADPCDNNNIFATLQFSVNEVLRTILPTNEKNLCVIHPIAVFYGK